MVFELSRLTCHPMPMPSVDILIHTLPYPIKRIHFGAQVGCKLSVLTCRSVYALFSPTIYVDDSGAWAELDSDTQSNATSADAAGQYGTGTEDSQGYHYAKDSSGGTWDDYTSFSYDNQFLNERSRNVKTLRLRYILWCDIMLIKYELKKIGAL